MESLDFLSEDRCSIQLSYGRKAIPGHRADDDHGPPHHRTCVMIAGTGPMPSWFGYSTLPLPYLRSDSYNEGL